MSTDARPADLPSNFGRCEVCGETFPAPTDINAVMDHLRLLHPDEYGDGPARWPDGGLVIIDTTLEPDEFADGAS